MVLLLSQLDRHDKYLRIEKKAMSALTILSLCACSVLHGQLQNGTAETVNVGLAAQNGTQIKLVRSHLPPGANVNLYGRAHLPRFKRQAFQCGFVY